MSLARPRFTLRQIRYKGRTVPLTARAPEEMAKELDAMIETLADPAIVTRSDAMLDAMYLWLTVEDRRRPDGAARAGSFPTPA